MQPGYLAKLDRAMHHIDKFESEARNWLKPDRYTIKQELDPDPSYQFRFRMVSQKPLPSDQFAVIIGDVLFNLRSSLDNLAFDLNGGDSLGSHSEFPIFGNVTRERKPCSGAEAHKGQVCKKIRGMCAEAQALIKSLQPYNRGDDYTYDLLWLLNDLCNIDKHRSIHIVRWAFEGVAISIDRCENFGGFAKYWSHSGPLETGTVIARYSVVPAKSDLEVKVCMEPKAEIAFADGPCGGQPVRAVLRILGDYVSESVIKPLAKFL